MNKCKRGHLRTPENLYANGTCKECMKAAAPLRAEAHYQQTLRWSRTAAGKASNWKRWLKYTYNITVEMVESLLRSQNDVCRICREPFTKRPCVDHDHSCCNGNRSCGECVRGLLCKRCNSLLGLCKDNSWILKQALKYLKETQCKIQKNT
jgi:hypothetical protein